jgi:subtilase family serine protease
MIMKKLAGCLGLIALATAVFAQTAPPRIVELRKNPPAEMLRSISLGQKSKSDMLHLAVSLPFGDPDGVQRFADAVSDPNSPLYRQFISPQEVGARFGLPARRVQRVRDYLASQGMNVKAVSKNRLSILVDATVEQAEAAFHTSIETFYVPATADSAEATRFSFTTPPAVPAEISNDVLDICGMDSFTRPKAHTALTATQLRSLYSVATMYGANGKEGAGRTIAISSFDGFRLSNISLECTLMSLPTPAAGAGSNVSVEVISGGSGSTGTASGEGDLDIQATLCMAPLASIIVYDNYQSSTTTGNNPIAVLTQEVDDNTADIVTESYGWQLGTSGNLAAHNLHLSMTAQGITYMAASGDHGTTWTVSGYDYNFPAIEPEVLSVGGTSATVNSSGTRLTEVGWNSNGDAGGGGWNVTTDTFNTRPAYQSTTAFLAGTGVPSLSSVPYRLVPDVSFDADPNTGYLIYLSGTKTQIGGTSGASPTCAGMLAELEEQLINDGALTANASGKYRLGRIQDLLYSFNGLSSVFYDVTSGTNGTLPSGAVSEAGTGWDTDSGWGPIIFSGLQAQIEKGVSSVTLSPTSVTGGTSSTGTVTLAVAAPTGGAVVNLTSTNTAAATVPTSVTVAAGATTATFTVTSYAVTSAQSATIKAVYNNISGSAVLTVNPMTVSSVTLNSASVVGGTSLTGTVTLSTAAPTGGTAVSLSSSSTSATMPSTVTVASGSKTATFTITTVAVSSSSSATITATLGTASTTASLTIQPASLSSVTLSSTTVVGGSNVTVTGTVTLNGAAGSGGNVVTLKSSSTTAATVPTSVTVAAGATTATFTITHKVVSASTSTTITGTFNSVSKTASLTVAPFAISTLSLSPTSVVGGASSTGTITLNAVPGSSTGAISVKLASSATSATVGSTVSIAAGASTGTFTITTKAVTKSTTSTITGTLGSSSKTATLTIQS